ncbi:MAG: hypothetical protein JOZ15_21195 [Acidobacteria bacterium]|nr:hypothetical protein [Acidobacteriota bacterium]
MPNWPEILQAQKSASTVFVLFVPSVDRFRELIDQEFWVAEVLRVLGRLFGGATAFPQGRGVWKDDERGGQLIFDAPVIVQCYTTEQTLEEKARELRDFLVRLGKEGRQGAVGFVIDRDYLEIRFPTEEE